MHKPTENPAKLEDSFASAFILEPPARYAREGRDNELKDSNIKQSKEVKPSHSKINMSSSFYKDLKEGSPGKELEKFQIKYEYLPLLSIPDIALEKILSFLPYDHVAQMRVICKR